MSTGRIQPRTWFAMAAVLCAATLIWPRVQTNPGGPHARRVLYYQDSMHPWIKSPEPGKCTVCSMDLTPIYEGDTSTGDGNVVVLRSNSISVLNVRSDVVKRQVMVKTLKVAGTFEPNSTRKPIVLARAPSGMQSVAVNYVRARDT